MYIKQGRRYRCATPSEVCEQASSYVMARLTGANLSSPRAAVEYVKHQAGLDHEQFGVIYLDKRHRVLSTQIEFKGTIDGAAVYPREIAKRCMIENAAAVIVFHNHPSGTSEPSQADEMITRRLKEALALIDVRLLDHLIVAGTTVCSLAELGMV